MLETTDLPVNIPPKSQANARLSPWLPRRPPALPFNRWNRRMKILSLLVVILLSLLGGSRWVGAAEPVIPNFWDSRERLPRPDLSGLERLRFLTTTDFPPFNFLDEGGRLTGFHVDLARAICTELDIADRCQIQALPWEELEPALERGDGEAIIAGLAATKDTRERYAFSRSYLRFPARFVVRRGADLAEPLHAAIAGKRVGVIAGSTHEGMLRDLFPDARPVAYSRQDWLAGDLKAGKIDAAFGDGMRLSFWLAGADAAGCCHFAGGPYLAPEYLGPGMAIASGLEDADLARAFDYALGAIQAKGIFAELYLRYFPVSFF
jgi:polar amino acid transport system substrate-binding protein